ncbi:MAG: hypothetical protein LBG44_10115 [Gemmatimonadota bacterium]|nr:hypothetical protein [Gemmatimonadota bacterium]
MVTFGVPGCPPGLRWTEENGRVDKFSAWVDLDCNGVPEMLSVKSGEGALKGFVVLHISGGEIDVEISTGFQDGAPQFVSFENIDGDSILDIVMASYDESVIYPHIILVGPGGPRNAIWNWKQPIDPLLLNFIHGGEGVPEECIQRMMPRIRTRPDGRNVVEVSSGDFAHGACDNPTITQFSLQNDTLYMVPQ